MPDNTLRAKKRRFCCNYVLYGNVAEAAIKAGFERENALNDGINCLKSAECKKLISELRDILSDSCNVITGLKRLAFGSCSDAVYLVFADELPPAHIIEDLDLFNVSEMKRVKGGGVEVKFFDRQKALEKLFEFETSYSNRGNAASLIEALTRKAISSEECAAIDNQ